jgi:hypothetical protein
VKEANSEAMTGALGSYTMTREASGTAWQPDASPHAGAHVRAGRWSLMGHATLFGVYDRQGGPRGGEKGFVSGMAMGIGAAAARPGHPAAAREPQPRSADGAERLSAAARLGRDRERVDPLIDRQHPHDLFMELSASYALRLGAEESSLFLYGGLPGEPAFGPPPFMHRQSIMASPEAPISHHWLDSTHISFGVVTAGLVLGDVKLEARASTAASPTSIASTSRPGRSIRPRSPVLEPDANPVAAGSWARLTGPSSSSRGEDQTRWSASALYNQPLGRTFPLVDDPRLGPPLERPLGSRCLHPRKRGDPGALDPVRASRADRE